jgi:hypothetical protein
MELQVRISDKELAALTKACVDILSPSNKVPGRCLSVGQEKFFLHHSKFLYSLILPFDPFWITGNIIKEDKN